MLLYLGQRRRGLKLKELAAQSRLTGYGAVAMAIKRYGNKLARDPAEATRMNNVIQMLNVKITRRTSFWQIVARRSLLSPSGSIRSGARFR